MADLFDTLFPVDPENLTFGRSFDIHNFHAGIVDYVSGNTTRNQIVNFLGLDTEQAADLDTLLAAVDAIGTVEGKISWLVQLQAVFLLASQGIKYDTKTEFATRLGL